MYAFLQLIGGLILAVGYMPQMVQLLKTRSCRDINLKTYVSLTAGIGLMELYALDLAHHGIAVMFAVTNSISLVIVASITIIIIRLRLKQNPVVNEQR